MWGPVASQETFAFRGHASVRWPLHSRLYRSLNTGNEVDEWDCPEPSKEDDMINAEDQILHFESMNWILCFGDLRTEFVLAT